MTTVPPSLTTINNFDINPASEITAASLDTASLTTKYRAV